MWIDSFRSATGPAGKELGRLIEEEVALAVTGVVVTEVVQGFIRDASSVVLPTQTGHLS